MLNFIIVIAVILIVAVLVAVFRVARLADIAKGETRKYVPSSNKLQAALLLLFLIAGIIGFFYYSLGGLDEDFVQPLASEHGAVTDNLFWITMLITSAVFVITQIFLFGFSFQYQHKEGRNVKFYPHNNLLEILWTGVPAIVLAGLIISGFLAWSDITGEAPEDSEVIEVMGYQYAWAFRYPGKDKNLGPSDFRKIDVINQMGVDFTDKKSFDDFIPTQLHVPKGKPVLLKIRARDVIHSFYQPHFRMQMNAVPGMPTRFWFVPTKSTKEMQEETGNPDFNYELVCNKICGKGHFAMKAIIIVDEPEEYEKWYAEQKSFLNLNPDYLSAVPEELREAARIAADIDQPSNLEEVGESVVSRLP